MATKALNYTTAEINQRLNLAATAAQTSAANQADIAELKSDIVVDLSTRYSTSYANLSAALTALDNDTATDAAAIKKGGVSIKFINSSTNKYEQWNLKASSWSTNTSDWALDADGSVSNGKLKLPFELAKPSNNTYVTQASEIGYNGMPIGDYPIDNILPLDESKHYANSDLTAGKRINSAGNVENNVAYVISDYVSLNNIASITVNSNKPDTISWIAFYDRDKQLLSNIVGDSGSTVTKDTVTPTDWGNAVYCRFCWYGNNSYYADFVYLQSAATKQEVEAVDSHALQEIATINAYLNRLPIDESKHYANSDLTTGQRINASGNIENNPTYRISDYISLDNIASISVRSVKPTTISWIAFYDKDKQLLSNIVGESNDLTTLTVTPTTWNNAVYCRFCWSSNNNHYALFEFDMEATSNKEFEECNMSIPDADKLANLRRTDIDLSTGNPSTAYKRLVLLHFADIHGDTKRFNRICDFYNIHKTRIDDVLLNGDIVGAVWADDITAMEANPDYNLFLKTLGNHDVNRYTGDSVLTDAYNRYFKNGISNWGVVQPENAEANGYMYYYKDYDDQNVRLIVLDCMHYDNTQNSWLIGVLADANTSGKHVMIAQHQQAVSYTKMSGFDCNYNSLHGDVGSYWYNSVVAVDNFINNGGVFICWLFGHVHSDRMGVFTDYPNQMYIIIGSAKCMSLWNECVREDGGYSQDLYDLVSIDTQSKHISIVRIGAKFDRLMRHKEFTVLDYNTRKVVSCY